MIISIGGSVEERDEPIATLAPGSRPRSEMARSVLRGAQEDSTGRRTNPRPGPRRAAAEEPDFFSKVDLAQAAMQAKTAASAYEVARSQAAQETTRIRQLETSLSRN